MATAVDYTHRTWREGMTGLIEGHQVIASALALQAVDLERVDAGASQRDFNARAQAQAMELAVMGRGILAEVDRHIAQPMGDAIAGAGGVREVAGEKGYHTPD